MIRTVFTVVILAFAFSTKAQVNVQTLIDSAYALVNSSEYVNHDTAKMEEVLRISRTVLAVDSTNINCYILNGIAYQHLMDFKKSADAFTTALRFDSTVFYCYEKLHWVYFQGMDDNARASVLRKKARRVYSNLLKNDTLNPKLNYLVAKSYTLCDYRTDSENAAASKYYNKAATLDSTNTEYLFDAYFNDANKERGFYKLKRALELEENWMYRAHYCVALNKRKQYADCVREVTIAIEKYPWYQGLYKIRAEAYAGLGDKVRQQEDLKKYKELLGN